MNIPMVGASRFIRTTWMLSAATELSLPHFGACIRLMPRQEAAELAERMRRRHVFARHPWENNFYVQRAHELGDAIERLAVLSTVFATSRSQLHRQLGMSS